MHGATPDAAEDHGRCAFRPLTHWPNARPPSGGNSQKLATTATAPRPYRHRGTCSSTRSSNSYGPLGCLPFRQPVLAVPRNENIALRIWSHRDRVEVGHWNPEFRYAAQPHLYRQRGQSGNPSGNWRTIALGIGNRA